MKARILAIAIFALAACAEPEPECNAATSYQGETIECDSGAGVCIAAGETFECMPRCAEVSPSCADGEWWRSVAVADGPPVCYCAPAPTDHVLWPIIRDHR